MIMYWLLFLCPSIGAISPIKMSPSLSRALWGLMLFTFWIAIGFREGLGGDWDNYLSHYFRVGGESFAEIFKHRSIGYSVVNWIAFQLNAGMYWVNALCAAVFLYGLGVFCWRQPLPWLSWVTITPYLVIVVGAGYTAQSVAIGLSFWLISEFDKGRIVKTCIILAFAIAFHQSALLVGALCILALLRPTHLRTFWGGLRNIGSLSQAKKLTSAAGVSLLMILALLGLKSQLFQSIESYLQRDYWNSEGALIRVMMNICPALVLLGLLAVSRRMRESTSPFWIWVSVFSVILIMFTQVSTTVADRLSLYLIVIQPYVISRIPSILTNDVLKGGVIAGTIFVYGMVLFVWLNYAEHSFYWVPYQNVLFK
jgi:hypothetical protein